jgi:hypothetical protein
MKKLTLTTIKSFIKREVTAGRLYIKKKSDFDGMVDCVMSCDSDWKKVDSFNFEEKNTYGIHGAWFIGRDLINTYSDDTFIGYEVYNCCGSFLLAFKR